jgi:hypothetical protein
MQKNRSSSILPYFVFILLSVISVIFSIYPIIVYRTSGIFYTIDPDIHYLSNVILYIKNHQLQFIGHPGTPTIIFLSFALAPLRAYAKFFSNEGFVDWVFNNYSLVVLYTRLIQSLIFGLSLFIYLSTVYKISKRLILVFLVWIILLTFTPFLFMGSSISPETLSFLFTSVFVLIFYYYIKSGFLYYLPFLSFLAGLAVANKFTNFFLLLIPVLIILFARKVKWLQKIYNLFLLAICSIAGFVYGTFPIRSRYPQLYKWAYDLVFSTGIHAGGEKVLFDINAYLVSIEMLINREKILYGIITLSLLGIIFYGLRNKKNISLDVLVLYLVGLLGVIIFSKYNLSHYQLANYLVIIVFVGYLLKRTKAVFIVGVIILLIPSVLKNVNFYRNTLFKGIENSYKLRIFEESNKSNQGIVWEWAKSEDFALIWSSDWASGIFNEQLKKKDPILYGLNGDMVSVRQGGQTFELFDVCWDKLYIQEVTLPAFLEVNDERLLKISKISNTKIYLVQSDHCSATKL